LAWSAIDAEPYCEEPVHHDRKRVHKLANIIAGVPVALAVGTAIFTMQHQTAAPSSAPSTPYVLDAGSVPVLVQGVGVRSACRLPGIARRANFA
jgi:hypothetical protein